MHAPFLEEEYNIMSRRASTPLTSSTTITTTATATTTTTRSPTSPRGSMSLGSNSSHHPTRAKSPRFVSDLVREYTEDAKELAIKFLPSCQERPNVHNSISQMIQGLYKEAEALTNTKVDQVSYVLYMPNNITNNDSGSNNIPLWKERLYDAELLDYLILYKIRFLRPTNKAKLAMLQRTFHREAASMKAEQLADAKSKYRRLRRSLSCLDDMMTSEQCRENHPHVYDLMVAERESLQKQYHQIKILLEDEYGSNSNNLSKASDDPFARSPSPTRVTDYSTQLWDTINFYLSPPTSPFRLSPASINHRVSSDDESDDDKSNASSTTAQDRWMDVVWLDEALDRLADDSPIRSMLMRFKNQCQTEAQELQKREASDMLLMRTVGPSPINGGISKSTSNLLMPDLVLGL